MTIPVEAIIALLTANVSFVGVCAHLLISILNKVGKMGENFEVARAVTGEKLAQLERHDRRNRQEIDGLRRHLHLPLQQENHS